MKRTRVSSTQFYRRLQHNQAPLHDIWLWYRLRNRAKSQTVCAIAQTVPAPDINSNQIHSKFIRKSSRHGWSKMRECIEIRSG